MTLERVPVVRQPRTSPPTERVVEILNFLARHPDEGFGISELARRVQLSKPTCLGIVATLTESGFLLRDDHKTYRLGPALIRLGHTAQEAMRVSPGAREELRELSMRFKTTAALSAVVADRITLLELVSPPGTTAPVPVGQSYPFAPPVGLMFVLWDDAAVQQWLAKEPTVPVRTDTDRLDRVIAECRADGYLAERLTPAGQRLYSLMAGISNDLPHELRALLGEMVSDIGERVYLRSDDAEESRHNISVISAPVFDHHCAQVMVCSLNIGGALTDDEIADRAAALIAAAAVLTDQLGGRGPS